MLEREEITVVLADDHNLVRQGIRALLEKSDDIAVVGDAADGYETLDLVRKLNPDVLVVDLAMPGLDGLGAICELAALSTATRVVVLTMYSDMAMVRRALQLGVSGYVLKGSSTDVLLLAIRAAHRGELFLSPEIARFVAEGFLQNQQKDEPVDPWDLLTAREREVLQHILRGKTSQAVAEELGVSVKTVEKHRFNLMSKLGVHNLTELVAVATRHQMVLPSEPAS
jgi:DNA-binding NarL/FixJ family response regulator